MKLPDSVIIYPAHGSGSPCGAEIGDRLNSTIGYERPLNPFLQFKDVESFTQVCRLHRAAHPEILSADEKGERGRPGSARTVYHALPVCRRRHLKRQSMSKRAF